ncbi:MAG: TonB family protein [Opitutus sp.]|nr:TonB family protein [Opitutus sp.]
MTDRTPAAFMISLTLHGAVVAILLFFTYAMNRPVRETPKIFELVAGAGDNYGATVAPALGTPGGVKINVPAPPAPKPEAPAVKTEPAPAKPEAIPVAPPPPKAVAPKTPTPRTPAQEIRRLVANADLKAKREVAKERAEDEKRAALAAKKMTEDVNKTAKVNPSTAPPKSSRIDAEGIAKGVLGGSTENKVGGANGKALTRAEGDLMDAYFSLLKRKLQDALERPAGLSDSLVATVQFTLGADGTVSRVRIAKKSGSVEFDRAVLEAFARVHSIGPRPDGKSEQLELDFRMLELDNL